MTARARCFWLVLVTAFAISRPGSAEEPARRAAPETSLPVGDVAALAAVREHLFVGMFDGGLVDVHVGEDAHRTSASALDRNVNALVVARAGAKLWVGTARGLFVCAIPKPERCTRVGENKSVHALLELDDGTLIAGADGGIFSVSPAGTIRVFDRKHAAPFRVVWALAAAADGTLFVGTTSGLYFGRPEAFFPSYAGVARTISAPPSVGLRRVAMITGDLPDDWVTAVVVSNTTVHVGTYNAGIVSFQFSEGALSLAAADPSLGYVNPNGIALLRGGELAVATMDGLRVGASGSFRTVPTLGRDVTAVFPTGAGDHWVASRRGVERLRLTSW